MNTPINNTLPVSNTEGKIIDAAIAEYKAVDGYNMSNDARALRLQQRQQNY